MLRPKLCLHRRILFLYLAIVLAGWTALTWRSHLKVYRLYFDSHEESQIKEVVCGNLTFQDTITMLTNYSL